MNEMKAFMNGGVWCRLQHLDDQNTWMNGMCGWLLVLRNDMLVKGPEVGRDVTGAKGWVKGEVGGTAA